MGKISLRTYDREIEALIEQGQRIDEAVAHCAHILEAYPRHLETQRLLAKAYVEAKRHEQAVDSFERVLASVPEDFVSHVGLSVIAADNGRLDDAILHMERAFEAQPSNAVIQGELQRLYGRRDGVEPPKVRLTRGALAHMYMEGELYSQAISEAKGVLSSDSERTDMQSLLARAYFRNGQDTEATQVCTELLGRYPYCLEANRLMAAMLVRSGREDLGEQFRQRLNELDPYAAFASESLLHTADVADSAITLDRLKYSAAEVDDGAVERLDAQPESTAVSFDAHAPGWLSDGAPKEASTTRGSRPTDDIPPFLRRPSRPDEALESEETREARTQNIQSTAGWVPDKLPPWMRKLAFTEQSAAAAKGPAATSDPPVWLRQLDSGQSPAGDRIRVHSTNATAGSDHDDQSRMHNAEAARLDRASGQRDAEDAAIPGFPSSGLQEDDALALLNTLS
jgi:tetratricopeptide (TPR) repeat protein